MMSLFPAAGEARISGTQAWVDFFTQNDHVIIDFYHTQAGPDIKTP